MRFLFLVFLLSGVFVYPSQLPSRFILKEGSSEVLSVPGVVRAALSESRIAKIKSVPPGELLISARKLGTTRLQIWFENGTQHSMDVQVVPAYEYDKLKYPNLEQVVKIQVEFLEIQSSFRSRYGMSWPDQAQFSFSGSSSNVGNGLNYTAVYSSTKGFIQAMVHDGLAKVLARPELYVRLGEEAVFQSGGELPIPSVQSSFGSAYQKIEWKPFGLNLKVRPTSSDGFNFGTDIDLNISEINSHLEANGVPAFTRRILQTKMNSVDGETVLLSGLIRQTAGEGKQGLPILKDIPLLGVLFSSKSESNENNELLMAITCSFSNRKRGREWHEEFKQRWQNHGGE